MRLKLSAVHRNWIIGTMMLLMILSVLSPLMSPQNLVFSNYNLSCFTLLNLDSQPIYLHEKKSDYPGFLVKPTLSVIFHINLLRWTDSHNTNDSDLADTLNLYFAILVIVLFIMFYRLSNTTLSDPISDAPC
jgi:hypothetical protein